MSDTTQKKNLLIKASIFVKNNIKIFTILLIILFSFLFTFLFYKNVQKNNNIEISEHYMQASILIKQKKIFESKLLLESIIKKNHQIYSPLALYMIIENEIESDTSKIINFFDEILKNSSLDKENLNLIKIKKGIYLINEDNEELIIETLNPIINSNSVWRNSAINLISEYFISKKQKIKSDEYIKLLSNVTNN